jgi:hypothetical protein
MKPSWTEDWEAALPPNEIIVGRGPDVLSEFWNLGRFQVGTMIMGVNPGSAPSRGRAFRVFCPFSLWEKVAEGRMRVGEPVKPWTR